MAGRQARGVELSVVSPCYNEEPGLPEFLRRVSSACEAVHRGYEVVLVNDGSNDRTLEVMHALAEQYPELVVVNLSRNHGHQLALTAGLSAARGERVLILDADLQDPPELLEPMLAMMDEGFDVVYGQRRKRAGETAFKLATASLFYRIIQRLADTPIPADTGDFRLISRRALNVLLTMPERHRFIRGMVSWIGFRQAPLLYDRDARFAGETKYPLHKMMRFAIDAVTGFSTRPLTFAITLGAWTALFSAALVIYSLVSWIGGRAVPGWTSLLSAVGLLGGAQLVMMGILGEYLGRLYEQAKGRPLFIIENVYRHGDRALETGSAGARSQFENLNSVSGLTSSPM